MNHRLLACVFVVLPSVGCNANAIAAFGSAKDREVVVVADAEDRLNHPRDLAFDADVLGRLWIVNEADDSMLILDGATVAGRAAVTIERRKDSHANHFMAHPSGIAMGVGQTFATCQESRNTYDDRAAADDFMGPALWPSDLEIFARINQSPFGDLLGSHLDMLHQSPLCMGIAHEVGNAYWVFDGFNGNLVRYDFQLDHGPGAHDHSDGLVWRFPDVELTRVENVPGHLIVDMERRRVYVADTGAGRVVSISIDSGDRGDNLRPHGEPLEEYHEILGADIEVLIDGLDQPSGLALAPGAILIGERGTGDVIAVDFEGKELDRLETGAAGLAGIALDAEGRLWMIDAATHRLLVAVDGRDG